MKTSIILILSILAVGTTKAQVPVSAKDQHKPAHVTMYRSKFIQSLLPVAKKSNKRKFPVRQSFFKSTESPKTEQLDSMLFDEFDSISMTWFPTDKSVFAYTGAQKLASENDFTLNPFTNDFAPISKYVYSYDDRNNLTRESDYYYDDINQKGWVEFYRYEYTYDDHNRLTQEIDYYTSTQDNTLVPDTKTDYTYDEIAYTVQVVYSYWDSQMAKWSLTTKDFYNYDDQGKLLSLETFQYDETLHTWSPSAKTVYTQEDPFTYTEENYYWDGTSSWMMGDKIRRKMDSAGNIISEIYYFNNGNTWVAYEQDSYTYNDDNLQLSYSTRYYDDYNKSWVNGDSLITIYDDNENIIQQRQFSWSETDSTYINSSKFELEYDLSSSGRAVAIPFSDTLSLAIFSNNKPTSAVMYDWDEMKNDWAPAQRIELYYSAFHPTGIKKIKNAAGINLYPNPVREDLTVTNVSGLAGTIMILDVNGREVMKGQFNSQTITKLNVSSLESGLYFLQVLGKGEILYSKKFVKY